MKKPIHLLIEAAVAGSIMASCIHSAAAQSSYDIIAVDTHTGVISHITKIADGNEYNPDWSPNGKQIVHDVYGGSGNYAQTLYVTDVKTGESHQLPGAEGGNDASWSPDGTTIAFDLYWWIIATVPAGGGTPTIIREDAISPDWSPGGNMLAFRQQSDGSIRTINLTTREETFLAYGEQPVWSPNGQYIAYNFNGGVWKIRVNDHGVPLEAPVVVTKTGGNPTWSNNSKQIAFHDWPINFDPDIYTVTDDGHGYSRLGGTSGGAENGDYDPSWSNNGQYVAWASYAAPEDYPPVTKYDARSLQNYPNPFTESTVITFTLAYTQSIEVAIYNLLGEKLVILASGDFSPGPHLVQWDGKGTDGTRMQDGIYLCKFRSYSTTETIRVKILH